MLAQRPQRPQRMTSLVEYDRPEDEDNQMDQATEMASPYSFVDNADRFAKALDFLSATQKSPAEQRADIFTLVEKYYQHATNKAHALRKGQSSTSSTGLRRLDDSSSQDSMELDDADNPSSAPDSADELERWEQEAQVWDLLRRLLPLRFSGRNAPKLVQREASKFQSTTALWDQFIQSDPLAQERKAILECLQTSADDTRINIDDLVRDFQKQADRGDIIAHGWLHTRSAIKMQKNVNSWTGPLDPTSADAGQLVDTNGSNPLVTQLDPDVATRQGRKLEPQDEYFERAIWLGCYELLRRGRSLNEIRDWCLERTEVWRAVSMSAMPLSKADEPQQPSTDPLSALLWRRTCFALARQGGIDDYERAVYGILSGDITSVEKVCKTWDDFVFAHYNALLRAQFDGYLMKRISPDSTASIHQAFPSFNALHFHGDASSASERLVNSLESNPKTSSEARHPLKALQGAIISNNLTQYMHDLGVALGKRANQSAPSSLIPEIDSVTVSVTDPRYFMMNDYEGLRVATHVYLLVSHLDRLQSGYDIIDAARRRAQDNIIATYVSILRLANLTDLMPLYCSKLEEERGFYTLSRNIARLEAPGDRDILLRIMEKLGMDIAKFVIYQPRSILEQARTPNQVIPAFGALTVFLNSPPTLKYGRPLKPDFFGDEPENFETVDESLIRSLEWFLLVDGLWEEFFSAGTAIYKRFLKNFNLHAARSLSERVRCSEIFRKKASVPITDDTDVSWFEELRSGALTSSYQGNDLDAEQVAAARNYFEMECLVRALDCMETIASSEAMAQDPTEDLGRDFWSHVGNEVKSIKSYMRPIFDGWLLESLSEDEDFQYLRDAYLPETIIGYVSVLHFAGTSLSRDNLLECMELASIIARKDSDVAAVLMKAGRMREIVEGFANCSKALAISSNEKKGSGGSSKKLREMGWTRELWSVQR
ncbi:nuclear pore protein 84/107 [Xylaria bambusicola]|uniref:nuclear pore protein 84/107 n=1 Tax=Xylaria bambusicola TaxID=326684 RepID=UPI0020075206|nr:nuclear pore protein 84/107 [Xylaria bambusicola]KAI0508515.1 nuclear pore protein 84/107 [Xylaria bambusicola]